MRTTALALAVLLACGAAYAQSQPATAWQLVGVSGGLAGFFDHKHSDRDGRIVTTVQLWVLAAPSADAGQKPYTWALMKSKFDCSNKTRQVLDVDSYDDADQLVSSDDVGLPPVFIAPGTINEEFLNAVCKNDYSGEGAFASIEDARKFAHAYFEGQHKTQGKQ
jgi:hypothetical protein